jgi:hypothetical protein
MKKGDQNAKEKIEERKEISASGSDSEEEIDGIGMSCLLTLS